MAKQEELGKDSGLADCLKSGATLCSTAVERRICLRKGHGLAERI